MSFLKKLFGGGSKEAAKAAATSEYKDYSIALTPIKEGSQYRICGVITKQVGETLKEHKLIRADTVGSVEEANEITLRKAKQMIDEQGDRLFG
ncbi:MAG: HlyU family transcriptional regulator [Nitratireductor sp.]